MTTTLAAATGGFVWGLIELMFRKHASILGFCSGIVAGLVVITPAAGFVNASGAIIIGVLAAVVPYIFVTAIKAKFGYDDALDTFGVHAVGGTLGALLTGFLATHEVNSNLANNLKEVVGHTLWINQIRAIGLTLTLSVLATIVLAFIVKAVVGLRPTPEVERMGLDINEHGEEGYVES
jgi:Amt family ammonium transporter